MNALSKEQIAVAANWWAEAVGNPKFDNGDSSPHGGMAAVFATLNSKPTAEVGAFKNELAKLLEAENPGGISVDYDPDQLLASAMTAGGIPLSNAPWKTRMSFRDGSVTVRHGYGAPEQVLLAAA